MPAKELMGWEPKQRLWRRSYGKVAYQISCKQLSKWCGRHVPETRAGSYQTANDWWRAKQAEIDGAAPPHRFAKHLHTLALHRTWAQKNGMGQLAAEIAREITRIEKGGMPPYIPTDKPITDEPPPRDSYTNEEPPHSYYEQLALENEIHDALNIFSPVWEERIKRDSVESTPVDRTVDFQVREFLAKLAGNEKAGEITAGELDTAKRCVNYFQGWIRDKFGPDSTIDRLNAKTVDDYFTHLRTCDISIGYKKKRMRFARSFIEWLASTELIPQPANLFNRKHRFKSVPKAIETLTAEQARFLIENAEGPLRLYLLLMANCGFTQVDCSDLRRDEIDFKQGRITRKRSKTKEEENVPIVSYRLWPETLTLLREYCEPTGEFALLTETKERLVRSYTKEDGKRYKYDAIRKPFERLAKSLKIETTPKILRKTSSSMLKKRQAYSEFDQVFLGHAPTTVAARNYSALPTGRFDKAVTWLRQRYGFTT